MWVYRSAEECAEPVVLFDYQPGRGQEYPQAFLAGYRGMLMSDGYASWRTLDGATHFGCLAHARRMFVDALKGQKKPGGRAAQALKYFEALYQVETLAKADLPDGQTRADSTYRLRQQHSVPLLNAFKAWLDKLAPQILPESLLGKAIAYTRNQWQYLSRYVGDGRAPVDNNVIERDIRPFCTGRKSWLFSDSVAGAKASAMVYSLMLTCRACGVDPHAYLLHVLTELPQRLSQRWLTSNGLWPSHSRSSAPMKCTTPLAPMSLMMRPSIERTTKSRKNSFSCAGVSVSKS